MGHENPSGLGQHRDLLTAGPYDAQPGLGCILVAIPMLFGVWCGLFRNPHKHRHHQLVKQCTSVSMQHGAC